VPLVAVTVNEYDPEGTELPTVIVALAETEPPGGGVTGFGETATLIPDGMLLGVRFTGELKPFADDTVNVTRPDAA
jgi:hypothetical protein